MSNVKKRVQSYRIKDLNSNDYVIDQSLPRQHDLRMTHKNAGRMNQSQLIRVANHNECSQIALTIKFENMAEQWFEEYAELNHRDTTLQRERNLCKMTYLAIGHMLLDEITTRDIQLFINDLAKYGVNMDNGKPLSYKTVRHHLSFVSDVFEYAIRMDIISYNPCLKVMFQRTFKTGHQRIMKREYIPKIKQESSLNYYPKPLQCIECTSHFVCLQAAAEQSFLVWSGKTLIMRSRPFTLCALQIIIKGILFEEV